MFGVNSPIFTRNQVGRWRTRSWGKTYYVSSVHANASAHTVASGLLPDNPINTLVGVMNKIADGDRIIIQRGHVESISSAAQLVLSKSGVEIIGEGNRTDVPKITFITATTASMTVSGDDNVFRNIRFSGDMAALVSAVNVTGDYNTFEECFLSGSAAMLYGFTCTGDGTSFLGLQASLLSAAGTAAIYLNGTAESRILDCQINGTFTAGCIDGNTGTTNTRLQIGRNMLETSHANDICINLKAAATGDVFHNFMRVPTDTILTWISNGGAVSLYENYGVNDDGETGLLEGTVSA